MSLITLMELFKVQAALIILDIEPYEIDLKMAARNINTVKYKMSIINVLITKPFAKEYIKFFPAYFFMDFDNCCVSCLYFFNSRFETRDIRISYA